MLTLPVQFARHGSCCLGYRGVVGAAGSLIFTSELLLCTPAPLCLGLSFWPREEMDHTQESDSDAEVMLQKEALD